MGWGLGDLWGGIVDIFGDQASDESTEIVSQESQQRWLTRLIVNSWTDSLNPGELPDMISYTGGPFSPLMVGWPLQVGVEAIGEPGSLPEGTFFIGHATPGMIMETLRMTQGGIETELDYKIQAGFVARLIQKTEYGDIIYIDGYEIGVERESGRIVREDLRLAAKSPLTAEVRYGGPIQPLLPLYIDISTYGDIGAVSGLDNLQVQVTATFLCQEVASTATGSESSPEVAASQEPAFYDPQDPRTTVNKSRRST